ncbi:hypothetical protein AVEN_170068-1 [Araneus ventricosus]|uniref:Integrase catalytic domain-containing protein n=1 Tax=Araneus ventricosus TaxID=182803 RepID=A0A4Y2LIQ1_ARAVE|nr:hypothetical protein AVEN_170068-1 [Araneus ventricosus]
MYIADILSRASLSDCEPENLNYNIFQVDDNGQQFRSAESAKFAKKWQFNNSTSSPYYSKGNGKAESAVKIVKNTIKKSIKDKDDIWLSILNWRNTPTANMNSSQRLEVSNN